MNSVIASMEIGFQVTISKSEVEMTSTLFSLVKNRSIMDLCFSQALIVRFGLLKKASELDLQDTGESPRDALSQQAAHVRLNVFQ